MLSHRRIGYLVAAAAVTSVFGAVALGSAGAAAEQAPTASAPTLAALNTTLGSSDIASAGESVALGQRFTKAAEDRTARAFDFTGGKGWVYPTSESVCIAVPDPGFGYGVSCTPMQDAVNFGVLVALVNPRNGGATSLAAALPAGGRVSVQAPSGGARSVEATDGVARFTAAAGSKISLGGTDGRTRSIVLPGAQDLKVSVNCDGLPKAPAPGSPVTCR